MNKPKKIIMHSMLILSLGFVVPMDDCGGAPKDGYYGAPPRSHSHKKQKGGCIICLPDTNNPKTYHRKYDNGGDYCMFGRRIYSNKKC